MPLTYTAYKGNVAIQRTTVPNIPYGISTAERQLTINFNIDSVRIVQTTEDFIVQTIVTRNVPEPIGGGQDQNGGGQ